MSYRLGTGRIPPVVKNLLIINALVLFAQFVFRNNTSFNFENFFALHGVQSQYFKPHQLITYMFMHSTYDFSHILFNMLAVWMFGSLLEEHWGAKRFLIFYILCGLGAGACQLVANYFEMSPFLQYFRSLSAEEQEALLSKIGGNPLDISIVGASGAVFGCLAAFAYLFPNMPVMIYFLFPVKAKWFVLFYAGLELYQGLKNSPGDSVAHWAHLGGALVGILIVIYWNRTNRRNFY